MPATSPRLRQELDQLVLQQVQAFKQSTIMNDQDILELHLRFYRIRMLLREMDQQSQCPESPMPPSNGHGFFV